MLWLTPAKTSRCKICKARSSSPGYFENLCSNTDSNYSIPTPQNQAQTATSITLGSLEKNKPCVAGVVSHLEPAFHTQNYSFGTHTAFTRHHTQSRTSRAAVSDHSTDGMLTPLWLRTQKCHQLKTLPHLPKLAHLLHPHDPPWQQKVKP